MPSTSARHIISINRKLLCKVSGCSRHRRGLGHWCNFHTGRSQRYGSPLGSVLRKKAYEVEYEQVRGLIAKHPTHAGVQSAVAWIGEWLSDAALGNVVPGQADMRRLSHHNVSPLQILTTASAIFAYHCREPRRLPDDADRLTFAIARAVLLLAPLDYRTSYLSGKPKSICRPLKATTLRNVGKHLRSVLGVLFIGIVDELNRQWQQHKDFRMSLGTSFTPHQSPAVPFNTKEKA